MASPNRFLTPTLTLPPTDSHSSRPLPPPLLSHSPRPPSFGRAAALFHLLPFFPLFFLSFSSPFPLSSLFHPVILSFGGKANAGCYATDIANFPPPPAKKLGSEFTHTNTPATATQATHTYFAYKAIRTLSRVERVPIAWNIFLEIVPSYPQRDPPLGLSIEKILDSSCPRFSLSPFSRQNQRDYSFIYFLPRSTLFHFLVRRGGDRGQRIARFTFLLFETTISQFMYPLTETTFSWDLQLEWIPQIPIREKDKKHLSHDRTFERTEAAKGGNEEDKGEKWGRDGYE